MANETIHYLQHGKAPCPISDSNEVPGDWPSGHLWSGKWGDVNCAGCLKHKPEEKE